MVTNGLNNYKIVYQEKNNDSLYFGVEFEENDILDYVKTTVKEKYFSVESTNEIIQDHEENWIEFGLDSTGFSVNNLSDIFTSNLKPKDWKIGETLAKCFLEEERNAKFYYDNIDDARNINANIQGADIVGFHNHGKSSIMFLFGEVKTSSSDKYPPNVVYGKSGLEGQLTDLIEEKEVVNNLIRTIAIKTTNLNINNELKKNYFRALKYFLETDKCGYKIVGILIRDVNPNKMDLEKRFKKLNSIIKKKMVLELIGCYLPFSIKSLEQIIMDDGENPDGS
ncbi:hypothetical protein NEF87_002761 [Candidatus Lokiarchaeum ossiferum]|uniref:Anti-bacteriophage protein A/HamA C-terminal domain-containing protein n=1 Tax=Candidatus Lokiarchaeum ossiferum TaxID=2951803 RepID=A0ABY6HST2_9ARCH|nr:hypothetical protein NEF87_002761 [Candidatus Lokiarchaeum sp. B-35]